jgi:acetylornithine/N-succinyldiaminopimelate aminotransferase
MGKLMDMDNTYVAHTYGRFPIEIKSGIGSLLTDENGKEYIDMGSGIGVTAFGIGDDKWKDAVIEQLGKVQHTSNLYYTDPCAILAKMLCERTGMKKVFFGNSGAEANECAIKAARKYASMKKGAEYFTIITLKNSFHGRTLTTLAATGQEHYHELYQPLTPGFVHVQPGDIEEFKKTAIESKAAGVLIEVIQGEGGVNVMDRDYVKGIEEFCKKNDIVFMVDEVQTGNGRTGKFYGYMNYDVNPDVVTTAKGIGGGLPIGLCMLGEKVKDVFEPGDHGSTFGGNPVCCAGAISIVERIDDDFLDSVNKKGQYIKDELKKAAGVEDVVGLGLMIGIKTSKPASEVVKKCMENGVLCLTAKDKVRLLPALNIPQELLAKAVEIIKEACAN